MDVFDRLERERLRRRAAQDRATPEAVERFGEIFKSHWWIPSSVSWALAKQGVSEEAVRAVSGSTARRKSRSGSGWRQIGEVAKVRRGRAVPASPRSPYGGGIGQAVEAGYEKGGVSVSGVAEPVAGFAGDAAGLV